MAKPTSEAGVLAQGQANAPAATDASGPKETKKKVKHVRTRDEKERAERLLRGPAVEVKKVKDKKLKGKLQHAEKIYRQSQQKAIKINEWLLPSEAGVLEAEGIERTWNFKQADIAAAVEEGAARKAFDLRLPELGPYAIDFSANGRYALLGGRKGHLAMMDWQRSQLVCEVQVKETTRAVQFLHNETFFAAAQKKYVYVYDKRGVEVHCLRDHGEVYALDYLKQHFLLCSVGDAGILRYQDTSTGHVVAMHKTKLGPCSAMRHNPYNGVIGLGHAGGVVTLWTPNITTPVVKMLCHRGPVNAVAFDATGHHMVTAGADGQVKVWDVRTFQPLHSYFAFSPATSLDISQRGMLAVGWGSKVQVWRDALREKQQSPYMVHTLLDGKLEAARFVPYEDVMGLGHSMGFSTILVPGAGEPNFDSYVANPFQSLRERREAEVHQLLDKLQPDTIVLDPEALARVRKEPKEVQKERQQEAVAANKAQRQKQDDKNEAKAKMKGKNRPSKRHRKKQTNIIEEKKPSIMQRMKEQAARKKEARKEAAKAKEAAAAQADVPRALQRFYAK